MRSEVKRERGKDAKQQVEEDVDVAEDDETSVGEALADLPDISDLSELVDISVLYYLWAVQDVIRTVLNVGGKAD